MSGLAITYIAIVAVVLIAAYVALVLIFLDEDGRKLFLGAPVVIASALAVRLSFEFGIGIGFAALSVFCIAAALLVIHFVPFLNEWAEEKGERLIEKMFAAYEWLVQKIKARAITPLANWFNEKIARHRRKRERLKKEPSPPKAPEPLPDQKEREAMIAKLKGREVKKKKPPPKKSGDFF